MNKTETHYAQVLEARLIAREIDSYRFESLTIRLAPGCRYTPDFCVITGDRDHQKITLVEVKSGRRRKSGRVGPHLEDDARVKLLAAARLYPEFDFVLAWRWQGQWEEEQIAK